MNSYRDRAEFKHELGILGLSTVSACHMDPEVRSSQMNALISVSPQMTHHVLLFCICPKRFACSRQKAFSLSIHLGIFFASYFYFCLETSIFFLLYLFILTEG